MLKTSRPANGIYCKQTIWVSVRKETFSCFVPISPTLHHWRLYFSETGLYGHLVFNSIRQKMNLNGIYYDLQLYYCQKFQSSVYNVLFSMSMSSSFLPNKIRYDFLFPYCDHTMVQFITCMESYYILFFLSFYSN